jgi:hypothetical protein
VEGYNARIRPQHRMIAQDIRPIRVIRVRRGQERHVVGLRVGPAFLERRVPERKVLQPEDLPHAVLLDVLVLVYATLPPLYQPTWVRVLDAFVGAGGHHAAEATLRSRAVCVDIDDALHLRVVEEEAVNGPIAASYEGFREAADVETLDSLFAMVAASEELDARVRMVGVELGNLLTSASDFVECTRRILPAGRDTCRDSSRKCTEACGCLPDLNSVNSGTLTVKSIAQSHTTQSRHF